MLTETRQTLRQTARGAAHFFDLGGPSHYSGNYLIGFEHCEPDRPKTHAKTTRRRGQHRTAATTTEHDAPVRALRSYSYKPATQEHTYYTMIVAELGFRMLERDTFHTKLVRY